MPKVSDFALRGRKVRSGAWLTLASLVALGTVGLSVAGMAWAGQKGAASSGPAHPQLQTIISDPRRDADRPRDVYRHPVATLDFFKVAPGLTVVEYAPGGGWYTRILAPYAGPKGRYIALNPDTNRVPVSDENRRAEALAWPASFPGKVAQWTGQPASLFSAYTSNAVPAMLNGTVDRVLMIRMLHNLKRWQIADSELQAVNRLLKPGGLLGVVQHRAKASAPDAYVDGTKGYLRQADVIRMVEANGFKLVGMSEVNANPRDSADYPGGVWTLPPANANDDPARYQAIGESDRMTLLFQKK